jgi:hypothetical protein
MPPTPSKQIDTYDFFEAIRSRWETVLRRMGDDHLLSNNIVASSILDVIISAANNLNCTAMQAFIRVSQNGLNICTGGGQSSCPPCGAELSARLSHLVECGAVWAFLAEECPGLGWDFSAEDRWTFLLGSRASDSDSATMLCLAWDAIQAGAIAGRFGGDAHEACIVRLRATCGRSGLAGRLARTMHRQ